MLAMSIPASASVDAPAREAVDGRECEDQRPDGHLRNADRPDADDLPQHQFPRARGGDHDLDDVRLLLLEIARTIICP